MPTRDEAREPSLPSFSNPPVNEVVLGVQGEPVSKLTAPFLGLFWQRIRKNYPKVEIHGALEPTIEFFGLPQAPSPPFRLMSKPETPRCWFITEDDTQLIQLQQDRLHHNWRRRRDEDSYPRYPSLRQLFAQEFADFLAFLDEEQLGAFIPNQCEVAYVNHLLCAPEDQGRLEVFFRRWGKPAEGGFLPPQEFMHFNGSYVITDGSDPVGRLHIASKQAIRKKDNARLLTFELTARGRPSSFDQQGVLRFLDLGREWIVRAFDELTTPSMHAQWGKQ